ncbi:hypothetical protein B0H14DRAFT_3487155 [Mycena olivaceomarginata]|nr:hypothetical protein B0H14DRAFT_3487155 [Mycena olivaceomarginata]
MPESVTVGVSVETGVSPWHEDDIAPFHAGVSLGLDCTGPGAFSSTLCFFHLLLPSSSSSGTRLFAPPTFSAPCFVFFFFLPPSFPSSPPLPSFRFTGLSFPLHTALVVCPPPLCPSSHASSPSPMPASATTRAFSATDICVIGLGAWCLHPPSPLVLTTVALSTRLHPALWPRTRAPSPHHLLLARLSCTCGSSSSSSLSLPSVCSPLFDAVLFGLELCFFSCMSPAATIAL